MSELKRKIKYFFSKENPIRDVIVFVIMLLVANAVWKFCFQGDNYHKEIMLFGKWNVEFLFQWAIDSTTYLSSSLLNLLGFGATITPDNVVTFANGNGAKIVWGCTAIKQSFIFAVVILCSKGRLKDKALFIAIGLVIIYFINILRISTILGFMKYNPGTFELLHGIILKYLFYICIFFMWVFWEEKFAEKKKLKNEK